MVWKLFRQGVVGVGLSVLLSGCAVLNQRKPPPFFEHEIQYSGETLGAIAGWYTGASANWRIIADANPGLNPHRLQIGQFVKIPRALVVRGEPFPKRLVEGKANRSKSGGKNAANSPAEPPAPSPADKEESLLAAEFTPEALTAAPPPQPTQAAPAAEETEEFVVPELPGVTPKPATTAPVAPAAPAANEPQQKTRDQLLKELLEGY